MSQTNSQNLELAETEQCCTQLLTPCSEPVGYLGTLTKFA